MCICTSPDARRCPEPLLCIVMLQCVIDCANNLDINFVYTVMTLSHNSLLFRLDYTMSVLELLWLSVLSGYRLSPILCTCWYHFKIFYRFFLAPPAFIKKPPNFVEVLLGDSLSLSCGAHGNPRPTVVWHKDDSQIEKHEKINVSCISRCHKLYHNQIDYPLKLAFLLFSLFFFCLSSLYPFSPALPLR